MINLFTDLPSTVIKRVDQLHLIQAYGGDCHLAVDKLLQKTVLMGGKRLRPLMTYLMADFFDLNLSDVDHLASSIELVHAASLAHDDVVDGASTRRGLPSINQVGGNKAAVLAGDYLLAKVIVRLSQSGNLILVQEMSQIIEALALGEWIQHEAAKNRHYSRQIIEEIALKKTASVMSWCTTAPALFGDKSPAVVEYARSFGTNLGVAFQLIDDCLDFSEKSNKDLFLDLDNGMINSVLFELLQENAKLHEAYGKGESLRSLWDSGEFTYEHLTGPLLKVRQKATEHLNQCRELLTVLAKETSHASKSEEVRKKPLLWILEYLACRDS